MVVTGGAGFIGSHLVDSLLLKGSKVLIIDDMSYGRKENVSSDAKLELVDIRDDDRINTVIDSWNPDYVFHLAAIATTKESSMGWKNIRDDAGVNSLGSANVFHAALSSNPDVKIVSASSGAVYGEPCEFPVTEQTPTKPISPYGVSKLCAEYYAHAFSREFNLSVTSARIFNTYGPRQPRYLLWDIFSKLSNNPEEITLIGDGTQRRDFLFVTDTIKGLMLCADTPSGTNRVYNLTSGTDLCIIDFVKAIAEVMGIEDLKIKCSGQSWKGDIKNLTGSNEKIRKELGFTVDISLREGLSRTLRTWRK